MCLIRTSLAVAKHRLIYYLRNVNFFEKTSNKIETVFVLVGELVTLNPSMWFNVTAPGRKVYDSVCIQWGEMSQGIKEIG